MEVEKGYGLCENIKDDQKWLALLNFYMENADSVEFNTLFDPQNLNPEIQSICSDLIEEGTRNDKIFPIGIFRRYRLSEKVRNFILSKSYREWKNYQFEDLSLIKDGVEILATIIHEDFIFALMDESQRRSFNALGYNFGELTEIKLLT